MKKGIYMLKLLTTKGARRKVEEGFNKIMIETNDELEDPLQRRKLRSLINLYSAKI